MDPNHHDQRFQLYALYVGINGMMVQTITQVTESTRENKMRMGAAFGTLVLNVFIARWVFPQSDNRWKTFIFNFTGIMPVYLAFSMLMPEWFTWLGFLIMFVILTILEFYQNLQRILELSYEKCVDIKNHLRQRF